MTRELSLNEHKQKGFTLFIVLVFLAAISIVSAISARRVLLSNSMNRNVMDYQIAQQAAESALRDAERDIANQNANSLLPNASCTRGFSGPVIPAYFYQSINCRQGFCNTGNGYASANWDSSTGGVAEPWWPTSKGGKWGPIGGSKKPNRKSKASIDTQHCDFYGGVPLGTFTGAQPIFGVSNQPEYMIEFFEKINPVTHDPASYFRITARGFGRSPETQAVLQTTFYKLR